MTGSQNEGTTQMPTIFEPTYCQRCAQDVPAFEVVTVNGQRMHAAPERGDLPSFFFDHLRRIGAA